MEKWHDFFVGELGAAAGFAGLLFVSLSVNVARIVKIGGLAERGSQALTSLFLVFAVSTLALAPERDPRAFGVETLIASLLQIVLQTRSQIIAQRLTEKTYRRSLLVIASISQVGSALFLIGSVDMIVYNDWAGLQYFVGGTLLAFTVAAILAWVLLIEIHR
jgi:modulator of FtsH protease